MRRRWKGRSSGDNHISRRRPQHFDQLPGHGLGEAALSLIYPAEGRVRCVACAKAEEAGAMLACGIQVDELLNENGKVIGIRAGEDEMFADVVIAADGVNSILAQKAGLAKMFSPGQVATGVKQIIELPAETISQRFGVEARTVQHSFSLGTAPTACRAGLSLYQKRASLWPCHKCRRAPKKTDKALRPYRGLQGQSCHSASDRGRDGCRVFSPPDSRGRARHDAADFGDGILIAGDAAGFVLNLGYVVRGMDFAIASGQAAARAIMEAKARNDFSRQALSRYEELLKQGFVLQGDLEAYRKAPVPGKRTDVQCLSQAGSRPCNPAFHGGRDSVRSSYENAFRAD